MRRGGATLFIFNGLLLIKGRCWAGKNPNGRRNLGRIHLSAGASFAPMMAVGVLLGVWYRGPLFGLMASGSMLTTGMIWSRPVERERTKWGVSSASACWYPDPGHGATWR
jgi:hypothetical protein